jgi:flagellar biosynthesis GTPase FlhF
MTNNIELHPQCAEIAPNTPLEEFETWLGLLLECQRDVLWQIGDLALAVERQHPHTFHQAFPEWVSPDLIERCKAVSKAYAPHERNILATWTIHMQNAKRPDRVALVDAAVDAGQTSDENRKNPAPVAQPELPKAHPTMSGETKPASKLKTGSKQKSAAEEREANKAAAQEEKERKKAEAAAERERKKEAAAEERERKKQEAAAERKRQKEEAAEAKLKAMPNDDRIRHIRDLHGQYIGKLLRLLDELHLVKPNRAALNASIQAAKGVKTW